MSPLASLELVVQDGGRVEARIAGELDLAFRTAGVVPVLPSGPSDTV